MIEFWTVLGIIFIAVTLIMAGKHVLAECTRKVTVWDYQKGLHYKHGRFVNELGAGKHRFWGAGHEVILYDARDTQLVVQGQELITADKAALKVTAVAVYRVAEPRKLIESAENGIAALYTDVQLALRRVIGAESIDAIIENKSAFGAELVELTRDAALERGIELVRIEVRDLMLGGELKRVFAGVIHARKEAEATLEKARGEAAALRTMANAARLFQNNPELMQLKYLQTLSEAGQGMGSTLVMGMPDWVATQALNKKR